jgi:hypothetical protein
VRTKPTLVEVVDVASDLLVDFKVACPNLLLIAPE